jgi:hypothetical protein
LAKLPITSARRHRRDRTLAAGPITVAKAERKPLSLSFFLSLSSTGAADFLSIACRQLDTRAPGFALVQSRRWLHSCTCEARITSNPSFPQRPPLFAGARHERRRQSARGSTPWHAPRLPAAVESARARARGLQGQSAPDGGTSLPRKPAASCITASPL